MSAPRETDLADSERTEQSQWFACEECGHATEVIDGIAGETLCYACWKRMGADA